MKNKILMCCFSFLVMSASLPAVRGEGLLSNATEPKIFVNNRILAKVNGKPISTYDVMKKMDIVFYKHYPEYINSTEARYQFYEVNWPQELDELVTKELILADAKENKIEVSGGDIRQEMESMFGPNIIANLDKVGMSFDEASKIIEGDIIIRRMIGGRVNTKIIGQITPAKVRSSYEEYINDPKNVVEDVWHYRVVTIKEKDLKKTEESAQKSFKLLQEGTSLDDLAAKLKEQNIPEKKGKVTVSAVIKSDDKDLSEAYKNVLSKLSNKQFSEPFSVKSRVDKTTVFRILFLEEKVNGQAPSFKELEPKIKDYLQNKAMDVETEAYITKLKHHFHVRDSDLKAMLPSDYQPFILKN